MHPSLHVIPRWLIILLLGFALVVAVATLKPTPPTAPLPKPTPPAVPVVMVEPRAQSLSVRSQGIVEPRHQVQLVAQVGAQVVKLSPRFVDGAFVKEGETLLELDARDYELAIIKAEARLADAQQLLAQEKGRARQARQEWRDLGDAEANALFLRKPQLAAAEATVEGARADLTQARINLERTRIRAPFDGRIHTAQADLGQYLAPGSQIATLYGSDVAEVRLPLSHKDAALVNLSLGQPDMEPIPVTLSADLAGTRHLWPAHLVRTDASIDSRTRIINAIAEVNDPFRATPEQPQPLLPGLFVEADIEGRPLQGVITLPRDCLFKGNHLFHLNPELRLRELEVNVLSTTSDRAWIQAALPAGTAVVCDKQGLLHEGMSVNPVPWDGAETTQP